MPAHSCQQELGEQLHETPLRERCPDGNRRFQPDDIDASQPRDPPPGVHRFFGEQGARPRGPDQGLPDGRPPSDPLHHDPPRLPPHRPLRPQPPRRRPRDLRGDPPEAAGKASGRSVVPLLQRQAGVHEVQPERGARVVHEVVEIAERVAPVSPYLLLGAAVDQLVGI